MPKRRTLLILAAVAASLPVGSHRPHWPRRLTQRASDFVKGIGDSWSPW